MRVLGTVGLVVAMGWPAMAYAETKAGLISPAQLAARERQKTCSAEWKDAKAAGKLAPGTKWPQFWSACNTRLKGAKG